MINITIIDTHPLKLLEMNIVNKIKFALALLTKY